MADITTGLVAHWKLDETSGTTAVDSSGNGHHGTYTNTPDLGVTGAFGTSLAVTFKRASTEYVALGGKSATADMTVALWLKRTDTAANHNIMAWGKTKLYVPAAGTSIEWYPDSDLASVAWAVAALGTAFHLVCVTQTGTSATLYVDGAIIGTVTAAAIDLASATSALAVAGVNALNGTLDDVRIYSRVLSAADVAALYAYSGFLPFILDDCE